MEHYLSQGKKRSWVNPAFDDFTVERNRSKTIPQDTITPSVRQSHGSDDEQNLDSLWVDKYKPQNKEILAVHKKKVAEVESWLDEFCIQDGSKKRSSVLLLTGPSGVGKTVTVHVLAKEMGFEVKEWINPLTSSHRSDFNSLQDKANCTTESQVKLFWDFMLRCNKYPSLPVVGEALSQKRLILVKDFPNIFLHNPADFHQILRKFSSVTRSPVLFIIGDNNRGLDVKSLFPKDLQQELGVSTISFNPVAATSLIRTLTRVASAELNPVPSKSTLESLAQLSAGDIRMALNTLQFTYATAGVKRHKVTKVSRGKRQVKKGKPKAESDKNLSSCGERDLTLYIFHAIGKVLHCKRDKEQPTDEDRLPTVAKAMARSPLCSVPELIVDNACLSADGLSLFLHQNYLAFFSTIEDVVRGSRYFSDADMIAADWVARASLEECSSLVVVRGLMHSNSSTTSVGWRPIHKPYWFTTNKLARQRKETLQHVCKDYRVAQEELLTDVLPYSDMIGQPANSAEAAILYKELCTYPKGVSNKIQGDNLDDHDIVIDVKPQQDDVDNIGDLPSRSSQSLLVEQEEYEIEDYDDDVL